jgi:hypothetical protein
MKEEQGSWGTSNERNFNYVDSPRQEDSDEDDPDFTDQPNRKKKYTYRKEVQRSYRQRVKSKKADIEAAVETTRQELEALAASNRYLQDNQQALELLNIEGAQLANTLSTMQAKSALNKNIAALPVENLFKVAEALLEDVFSGEAVLSDDQVRLYISLPAPVLVKTEADFISRLDSLMAEVRRFFNFQLIIIFSLF